MTTTLNLDDPVAVVLAAVGVAVDVGAGGGGAEPGYTVLTASMIAPHLVAALRGPAGGSPNQGSGTR